MVVPPWSAMVPVFDDLLTTGALSDVDVVITEEQVKHTDDSWHKPFSISSSQPGPGGNTDHSVESSSHSSKEGGCPSQDSTTSTDSTAQHSSGQATGGLGNLPSLSTPTEPEAAAHQAVIAAHKVVLWSLSPVFKSKIQRWEEAHIAGTKPSLQVLVPAGQLDVGRALLTAMYASSPQEWQPHLTPVQLLQLAALAECYMVHKVQAAAAAALARVRWSSVPLLEAAAVLDLPHHTQQLEAFQGIAAAVGNRLQQVLGNLELVWSAPDKQELLEQLTLNMFIQLLSDARTRATSEDTVFYTIQHWLKLRRGVPDGFKHQLAALLRLHHCTPSFLVSSVCHPGSWLRNCGFPEHTLFTACTLAGMPDSDPGSWADSNSHSSRSSSSGGGHSLSAERQWQLPPRPKPFWTGAVLSWSIPLRQVKAAYQKRQVLLLAGPSSGIFQGRAFQLSAHVKPMGLQFFVQVDGADACVTGSVIGSGATFGAAGQAALQLSGGIVHAGSCSEPVSIPWSRGVGLVEWEEVEASLWQGGWVVSKPEGPCISLTATLQIVR